jgi:hypothetical protein
LEAPLLRRTAEAVVDALFKPDPMIDNAQMPPEHQLQDRGGWPVCRCGFTVAHHGVEAHNAEDVVKAHVEGWRA